MADKLKGRACTASKDCWISIDGERSVFSENLQNVKRLPCRCAQNAQNQSLNCCCFAAASAVSGNADRKHGYENPDGFDDAELEAILREFTQLLIDLLKPCYAEVIWRSEVLDQSPSKLAQAMNLNEQVVAERLERGRSALLHLVLSTLQQPIEG